MDLWILSWFFLHCYPIARLTIQLERRFTVRLQEPVPVPRSLTDRITRWRA